MPRNAGARVGNECGMQRVMYISKQDIVPAKQIGDGGREDSCVDDGWYRDGADKTRQATLCRDVWRRKGWNGERWFQVEGGCRRKRRRRNREASSPPSSNLLFFFFQRREGPLFWLSRHRREEKNLEQQKREREREKRERERERLTAHTQILRIGGSEAEACDQTDPSQAGEHS